MNTKHAVLGAALVACSGAVTAGAATLDDVKARGKLNCGINTGVLGFAMADETGYWNGFDVALCRAVAVAVLGDKDAVEFVNLTGTTRFTSLASGEIDLLSRNTTWTLSRDADLKFTFAGVNYYDGQGFLVPASLGVKSATELNEATICVQTGTTTELNLADFCRANNITCDTVPIETNAIALEQYNSGICDAYTTDASGLAASRASFEDPDAHVILPEIISKEPLGPLVRQGDEQWADIVRWTLNAMIAADEFGVTSENVEQIAAETENPEIRRMLGVEENLGAMLGLQPDWAKNVIAQIGNYGEVFDANIGEGSEIGLPRGLNAQYTEGGLLYALPFR